MNNNIMDICHFCEDREIDYDTFYNRIYKMKNVPSWVIKKGRKTFINVALINELTTTEKSAWVFATSHLYWWLTEWMKLSISEMSEMIANRSKTYTSINSWNTYFYHELFSIKDNDMILSEDRSRVQEFVIYGTAIALAYYRDNYAGIVI